MQGIISNFWQGLANSSEYDLRNYGKLVKVVEHVIIVSNWCTWLFPIDLFFFLLSFTTSALTSVHHSRNLGKEVKPSPVLQCVRTWCMLSLGKKEPFWHKAVRDELQYFTAAHFDFVERKIVRGTKNSYWYCTSAQYLTGTRFDCSTKKWHNTIWFMKDDDSVTANLGLVDIPKDRELEIQGWAKKWAPPRLLDR